MRIGDEPYAILNVQVGGRRAVASLCTAAPGSVMGTSGAETTVWPNPTRRAGRTLGARSTGTRAWPSATGSTSASSSAPVDCRSRWIASAPGPPLALGAATLDTSVPLQPPQPRMILQSRSATFDARRSRAGRAAARTAGRPRFPSRRPPSSPARTARTLTATRKRACRGLTPVKSLPNHLPRRGVRSSARHRPTAPLADRAPPLQMLARQRRLCRLCQRDALQLRRRRRLRHPLLAAPASEPCSGAKHPACYWIS